MRRAILLLPLCVIFAIASPAQTFTKLHDFQGSSDGSNPMARWFRAATAAYTVKLRRMEGSAEHVIKRSHQKAR